MSDDFLANYDFYQRIKLSYCCCQLFKGTENRKKGGVDFQNLICIYSFATGFVYCIAQISLSLFLSLSLSHVYALSVYILNIGSLTISYNSVSSEVIIGEKPGPNLPC